MNNDRDVMRNDRNMPVMPGTDVYDASGDKVGSVQEYNPQADYLVVKKGMIFTKDLYIPASAIDSRASDGVYLNLTKDQLKDERFSNPPTYSGARATDDDILDRDTAGQVTRDDVMDRSDAIWDRDPDRDRDLNS